MRYLQERLWQHFYAIYTLIYNGRKFIVLFKEFVDLLIRIYEVQYYMTIVVTGTNRDAYIVTTEAEGSTD